MIPTNITIVSPPMIASVLAALRAFGFLKFGTPLLTASTPVSAVQPEAKARSSSADQQQTGDVLLGLDPEVARTRRPARHR